MYWMLATAALSAFSSLSQGQQQRSQDKAHNRAVREYNTQVVKQTARSLSELSVQKAYLAQQTTDALATVQRQGMEEKSNRGLQAAASDTMGASVRQTLLDAQRQVDESSAQLMYNTEIKDHEINAQAQSVADSGKSNLQRERPVTNAWGNVLGSALGSLATSYIGGKMASAGATATTNKASTSRRQGV